MLKISVVIPTYNRENQLSEVIDYMLRSDVEEFEEVEIIVVDDGSEIPAKSVVEHKKASLPFALKYFYQNNSGPAEARNNGFRQARNEIVLFIDDDILVFPDLIAKHAKAHNKYKGSVIFGQSPYVKPNSTTASYRFLEHINDIGFKSVEKNDADAHFIKVSSVASGNLSVEKHLFRHENAVYGKQLQIPASEEFDLALQLEERKIPIYMATEIKGWHLQPATIEDKCKQEYKYGLGIAEVALKNPRALEISQLKNMFEYNRGIQTNDSFLTKTKKFIRKILAKKVIREYSLKAVTKAENIIQKDRVLFPLYKIVVSAYFFAGVQDGILRFQKITKPNKI